MTSKTETALEAFFQALLAYADDHPDVLPVCLRNEALPARFADAGANIEWHLNLWDGDTDTETEFLGAEVLPDGYELIHTAPLELVVAGGERLAREAKFDAVIDAVLAVIGADMTLGGVVDRVTIRRVEGQQQRLAELGVPNAKGATLPVEFSYTSSRIR